MKDTQQQKQKQRENESPETTEHLSFSNLVEVILNASKLNHHIHKLETLSNLSNVESRNDKMNAQQK